MNRSAQGFTLLEILLAMLLLALVVSMISIALSGSMQVIDATEQQGDIYHRARIAMQRISDDLASAMLTDDLDFIGSRHEVGGERGDTLRFGSMAHLVFAPETQLPGIGIIGYEVVPDRDREGELALLRSDLLYRPGMRTGDGPPEGERFLLCDRLRSVRFTFFDQQGEAHDNWNTRRREGEKERERGLPAAVQCSLEFWLDREQGTTLTFTTSILLPTGVIHAAQKGTNTF